jgi:hypothetical protein
MDELLRIEEQERDILFKLGWIFKNSLNDFSTSMDRSLNYLDKIVLPIIMGSKDDRSYNPFSEIIEKYVIHILIHKFEKEEYFLLPLGYSSDLTLENDNHILNIDIKTANIDNPSDFRKTINVGISQLTHVAKLRLSRKFLPSPYFVYPNIPPFYQMPDGSKKLIFTYALMFIYPSYSDLVGNVRNEYNSLFNFFNKKVKSAISSIFQENFNFPEEEVQRIIMSRAQESRYSNVELITESLIRGVFIHRQEEKNILKSLKISKEEYRKLMEFVELIEKFTYQFKEKDIKPIAIIAISLPNGLLKDKYLHKFVSGKSYAKSARYHYENGIFEVIKEISGEEFPRVIFIDLNKEYLDELKQYFDGVVILDYQLKVL